MVRAVMTEGQARHRSGDGATDQLMTETEAEDRYGPRGPALRHRVEEQLHVVRDQRDRRRITRAIADHDAFGRPRQHVARARGRGKDLHRRTARRETTDLILFDAGVEQGDLRTASYLPADAARFDDKC